MTTLPSLAQYQALGTTRWTRVDPDRYFIVLAARKGEFYDTSGSAFPMVIKLAGGVPTIDAFGIYLGEQADRPLAPFLPPYTKSI